MAKVLSKYSKTKNLATEYTSQTDYIDAMMAQQKSIAGDDIDTPLTFKEWYGRNVGIIAGEEYIQYNEYLKNWYQNRYKPSELTTNIKNDYINLLKQLRVVLKDDENMWIQDIDFTNDLEIESAIPYFARKLKEISIYLINKRDAIKKAKLKYNMAGSNQSLEKLFYEYLLKAFTKRNYVLNVPEQSAWNAFPELSAINKNFQISIEELYDDTEYFDKDYRLAPSAYYDLTQQTSSYYIDTLNMDSSAMNWLFGTGFMEICANNPLVVTLSSMLTEDDNNRIKLSQKYLGEDQYALNDGYWILKTKDFTYNIQQGNNWFYWPSGEYYMETMPDTFDPIMLSATNLSNIGTAAINYKDADKIFTQAGNVLKGAWLKLEKTTSMIQTMSAILSNNSILKFRFPYPGYGISGEGLDWTGKQLSNIDNTFNYLNNEEQENILNAYWTNTTPVSTFNNISIHDTKLIEDRASASHYYDTADKVIVRTSNNIDMIHDGTPDSVYTDGFNYAWLYKMLKTDLPIKVGQTHINWPIENYEYTTKLQIPSNQCIPAALSSINVEETMIGARAGYGLYDSDIIYKLDSPVGYPIECAFLSGEDLGTIVPHASGKIQPSFTLLCKPGNYETFIWVDDNIDINNTTITHKEHQIDCQYLLSTHDSIYATRGKTLNELNMTNTGIGNYKDCDCKAIWYSPLGHPGSTYDDYDRMADIIFVDKNWNTMTSTGWPSAFDITTWRGTDGLPYNQSADFAWYQITGTNVEQDIGWGKGRWIAGNGSSFSLQKGIQYKYLRANLRRNPDDLLLQAVPSLIIKQQHVNTVPAKWIKCILQDDGTWLKTSSASDMILKPGDYILYDHIDSYWYCLETEGDTGTAYTTEASALYLGDYYGWLTYNYVITGTEIKVTWPDKYYAVNPPSMLASEAVDVSWDIKYNGNLIHHVEKIDPAQYAVFTTVSAGTYTVIATAFGNSRNEIYTQITPITCTNPIITQYISGHIGIETIYNDRINFVANIPLSGWNYVTNSYDGVSYGSRPFWAKGYDDNSRITKYKGIDTWGGGIKSDDYTFITQPDISDLSLSADCYIEVHHSGNNIIWEEPISFNINVENKDWKEIQLYKNTISPLSSYLLNIKDELVISATDITSDISLYQPVDDKMWINYHAVNPFTWTQKLTDSSVGIPPSGGTWIPYVTSLMIDTMVPYANLTNRHFPTIATVPYIDNLYTTKDSGGYFVPKMLGASTYIGKNYTNIIDLSRIGNDPTTRGLSGIFQDIDIYRSDNGLSQTLQIDPLSTVKINSSWMKATLSEGYKAGDITDAKLYQEFMPYQTKYESTNVNNYGLRTQDDQYDPWYGDYDNIWKDNLYFPPNFRNEYSIDAWYDKIQHPNKVVWEWKTDIFNNQYFLLKNRTGGIYEKNVSFGELWVRNTQGCVTPASSLLSAFYVDINTISPTISTEIQSIKHFDVWFDTLMLQTSSYVVTDKIIFDYDNGLIDSVADNIRYIQLDNNKLVGTWLFEETKKVTICTLVSSSNNIYYPELYVLDLNTNELVKQYTGNGNTYVNQMSSMQLTSIEDPVFTYNSAAKEYYINFLGYSPLYFNMVLNTIIIKNYDSLSEISKITSITPLV